jgi:hypothetical protein|tara:strand:- start:1926 stop:2081 length:156 start_codon:yes stop_codon:yes gene_type:complete
LKIDLDITALNVISSSLKNVTLKGEDAVAFAKVITKIDTAFEKELGKQKNG